MSMRCVHCGYSLDGLPEEHSCPECGFPFDKSLPVWKRRWTIGLVAQAVTIVVLLGYAGVMYFTSPVGRRNSVLVDFPIAFYVTVGIVWALGLWRAYRHGQTLAVTPVGVFLRLGKSPFQVIRWADISHVEIDRRRSGAHLLVKNSRLTRYIQGFFKDRADAERFVQVVQERMAQEYTSTKGAMSPNAS